MKVFRAIQCFFVSLFLMFSSKLWSEQLAWPTQVDDGKQPKPTLQGNNDQSRQNRNDDLVSEKNPEKRVPAFEFREDPLIKGMPEDVLSFPVLSAQELFDAMVSETAYECAYKWRPLQKIGDLEDRCFDSTCGTNLLCREAAVKNMLKNRQRLLDGG